MRAHLNNNWFFVKVARGEWSFMIVAERLRIEYAQDN